MKKRLKGLVSLWLAAAMVFSMMTVPAMAADPVIAFVYTGDTSPVPGEWHNSYEYVSLVFDTPLIEQEEIMNKLPIPAGGVLNGWRLWSTNSGGLVYEGVEPITIGKDDGIGESTWSSLADNMNDYLMIEQLWTMMYRINPQPTNADPTVGGEAYDEATTTWSKTDDVTYQWCEVTTEETVYTVVETASADDPIGASAYIGSYAGGSWSSAENTAYVDPVHELDITFTVQAGDVVTVTPSATFSGTVEEYYGDEYTAANGSYTMTMTEDKDHNLYITSTSGEAFTATVTVTRSATTYTLLNGQISETLDTANLPGGTYVCKVTFDPDGDNVTLTSDEVEFISVSLDPTTLTMTVGDTAALTATVTPNDATNKNVTWSSSNEDVATVDQSGKVTAVSDGNAIITVTTEDGGKTDTCDVTVNPVPVTDVSLTPTELTMTVGGTAELTATVSPNNATNKAVTWSSSDTSIATVDQNGKVTAVSVGNATITVTTEDGGKTATCAVTVNPVSVTGVSLTPTELTMTVGDSETLTATVSPGNATNKAVTWSSSDETIATVDQNGKVTAVSAGNATITVTTVDGDKTDTCAVTVNPVSVTGVELNKETLELDPDSSETLIATVTPDNAANKAVTWSSSDETIATVDQNGKVTAVSVGNATITVTTEDGGKTDTCEVTVTTTYTVTLDGNGLEYDMKIVVISGETATKAYNRVMGSDVQDAGEEIKPDRDGYTFGGWYTDQDVKYDFTKVVTEDITVYAKWTANSYTVQFYANGGKGTMADQTFTYDVAQNLTSNDFTRDGYTFIGWAENESGEVKYTDGQSVKNLTDAKDGTVDLYAKWEEDAPPVVTPPVVTPPVVISGTASLTKVDAEDPTTVLPGVVFELRQSNGALMGTYTTNASGQITVYGLVPGTYYWRETRPAEGYVLDGTERVFTVYAGQTTSLVVENERSGVPGVFGGDHDAYIIGSDGLVRPEANITRAEVATIFFRLLNEETRAAYLTDENTFADVNEGDWFNTAASTMAAMGIMTGLPDGGFHPMQNITRAEFAAVAARFDANGNTTGASFTDIYGHWAEDEINIAANNGWILGFDGKFRPDDLITRAEAMTMINRVLQRIPEHPDDLLDHMVTWPDNMDPSKWYYLAVQEATNSHNYGRKENGYEYWTGLRAVPDWAALED